MFVQKLQIKIEVFYRYTAQSILSTLDYEDILYIHAPTTNLKITSYSTVSTQPFIIPLILSTGHH